VLETAEGKRIETVNELTGRSTSTGKGIVIELPSTLFHDGGDYLLKLSAINARWASLTVDAYTFHVTMKESLCCPLLLP